MPSKARTRTAPARASDRGPPPFSLTTRSSPQGNDTTCLAMFDWGIINSQDLRILFGKVTCRRLIKSRYHVTEQIAHKLKLAQRHGGVQMRGKGVYIIPGRL